MFSPKAMVQFEPYMTTALSSLGKRMEDLIDTGVGGKYIALNEIDSEIRSRMKKGEAAIDVAIWSAFLAFDIIGDLVSQIKSRISPFFITSQAFGAPFGFTSAGEDAVGGIKKLRDRGEWCATVGQMPWIKSDYPQAVSILTILISV